MELNIIDSQKLPSPKYNSTLRRKFYLLSDFKDRLLKEYNDNHKKYGVGFLCYSKSLSKSFNKVLLYSKTKYFIFIEGEEGEGKSVLAKVAHHNREGRKLLELCCLEFSENIIVDKLISHIENKKKDGILIKNIQALFEKDCSKILRILKKMDDDKFRLYITLSGNLESQRGPLAYYLCNKLRVNIPPFCLRKNIKLALNI